MAGEDVVSLMVLPSLPLDAPPQILLSSDGVWRDMSPASSARNEVSISQTKEQVDRLLNSVMSEVGEGKPHSARNGVMTSNFMNLYEDILPQSVRDTLSAKGAQQPAAPGAAPTLLIHLHPQSEWVPWEMLHDGDNYLGLKWQIARLPIVSKNVSPGPRPHAVQTIYSLLGKNVFEQPEAQLLAAWQGTFDGRPQEHRMPPPGDDKYPDADTITNMRDADILHITCHGGVKNEDGEFVWTLDHRSSSEFSHHITQKMVSKLALPTRPLVFGNACASTSAGAGGGGGLIPGFGTSFFAQGALNFVGTFAPVTKAVAVDFAREFYRRLLGQNGQPGVGIASALLKTKAAFFERDVPGQSDKPDLSYLFYCLYGLHDTTYQG